MTSQLGKAAIQRRHFLSLAGGISASLLTRPWHALAEGTKARGIRLYSTSGAAKHQERAAIPWSTHATPTSTAETLHVNASERLQPMLGFGCAYTDASCFLLSGMQGEARSKFLTETFSPTGMNLNLGRTTIGASDYSRDVYNYDDVPGDVELKHFTIAHDEAYILPMLREMRSINPELFLLATPWSPPGWMKTYGSMLGGWMTNKYLDPYAHYLARYLESYRKAGVTINAITAQNEIETDQSGSMPAAYWPPELESDFIRDHLGPLLRKQDDKTQIWLLDHNYNLWKRVKWQLADPELRRYVGGVAWHGYVGTPDQMSRLHDTEAQMPFYWTEGGPDISDPKYSTDWTRWGTVFSAAISNWCRCLITWNLMLDERGAPNIGPFSCGGLVTLRRHGDLEYSGQYWALRHFSQHIQRGALRIGSHADASELSHVAFANGDGSFVLVLTNTGEERTRRIASGSSEAEVRLDANSMTTLVW